jgi:hypothetical protein
LVEKAFYQYVASKNIFISGPSADFLSYAGTGQKQGDRSAKTIRHQERNRTQTQLSARAACKEAQSGMKKLSYQFESKR